MDYNDGCEKVRSNNNGMFSKCSQKLFQASKTIFDGVISIILLGDKL